MPTVAEALNIKWGYDPAPKYQLTLHAKRQAAAKGWSLRDVVLAAEQPLHTYPSGRVPGQVRHVRDGLVAVIDTRNGRVVTVYADRIETDLRPDQTDPDALRYAAKRKR